MKIFGAMIGIEPTFPAFQVSMLTTTPQHPGTKCNKFASSNHPWQMVLQHDVITTVFTHCESATYTVVHPWQMMLQHDVITTVFTQWNKMSAIS